MDTSTFVKSKNGISLFMTLKKTFKIIADKHEEVVEKIMINIIWMMYNMI